MLRFTYLPEEGSKGTSLNNRSLSSLVLEELEELRMQTCTVSQVMG